VAEIDGLGSYGSFPIPQLGAMNESLANYPDIPKMHYKVNWDLSGRFYHYMGMYAPPVGVTAGRVATAVVDTASSVASAVASAAATAASDGRTPSRWLNRWNPFGSRGGRLTYNVSYTNKDGPYSIDALYSQAQVCTHISHPFPALATPLTC
jgi:hypothetical protein